MRQVLLRALCLTRLLAHSLPPRPTHSQQCGPRFELRPYQLKLGTVDQAHTENEWVLRAYTRSTKKAKLADDEDGGDEA